MEESTKINITARAPWCGLLHKEKFTEAVYFMLKSRMPAQMKALAVHFGISSTQVRNGIIGYADQLIINNSLRQPVKFLNKSSIVSNAEFRRNVNLMLDSQEVQPHLKVLAQRLSLITSYSASGQSNLGIFALQKWHPADSQALSFSLVGKRGHFEPPSNLIFLGYAKPNVCARTNVHLTPVLEKGVTYYD